MSDAWRLAVGTLTTFPVPAPRRVTPRTAGTAMLLAPVPGALLGIWAGAVFWGVAALDLGPLVASVLAVVALRLGDRAFHLDGLADTADGLAASYDRDRALEVMRTGDTGPAGAVAIGTALLLQVAAMTRFGDGAADGGAAALGVAGCVAVSRGMLALGCLRGIPAARPEGLGATVAGSVRALPAAAMLVLLTVASALAWLPADLPLWSAPVVVAAAAVVSAVVLHRCVRRFGGITGDVLGAVVEVSLAAALMALAVVVAQSA